MAFTPFSFPPHKQKKIKAFFSTSVAFLRQRTSNAPHRDHTNSRHDFLLCVEGLFVTSALLSTVRIRSRNLKTEKQFSPRPQRTRTMQRRDSWSRKSSWMCHMIEEDSNPGDEGVRAQVNSRNYQFKQTAAENTSA